MRQRQLRGQCLRLLRGIPIPTPFSAEAMCEVIAEHRGRRLYLHPMPELDDVEGAPCGMWLATDVADHIFVERQTSPFHQEHIILHEIGHMLCGHAMPALSETAVSAEPGDPVDPAIVHGALTRTSYTNYQEREAEMVATLVLESIGRLPAPTPFTGMLAGLEQGIGYHRTGH
ncbi:hypothetical protein LWC34_04140 [Kibdelosporangium philippinense]|uniref:IrrE N-terminal-like domain-containing protein n=1 Tax=Kibdelosporangium philippinense TaxID=211113 RepID=A0ABS8Z4R6_9PSEU|nr:hypothetical protein [Kibdelosporangium philippinense]MCE7002023.1 hypothetical protein [Kibdelosporangium philippinense]